MIFRTTVVLLSVHLIVCAPTDSTDDQGHLGGTYDLPPKTSGDDTPSWVGALLGCGKTLYSCQTRALKPVCITMDKLCDGVKDCPSGEDENNNLCLPAELKDRLEKAAKEGTENDFSGTGFMFSVNNLVVSGNSRVKMFNQESDNVAEGNATQEVVNDGGQSQQQEQQHYG